MAARWYVLHVYSGFEAKVAEAIREKAQKQGIEDRIEDIMVPTEEVVEIKRGQKVNSERKVFPGYVLAKMDMSDQIWHLVKDTPKVTGFLGGGQSPCANQRKRGRPFDDPIARGHRETTRRHHL